MASATDGVANRRDRTGAGRPELVAVSSADAQSRLYNTAKQKLMSGQQIVGGEPEYEALITRIKEDTLGSGKALGGPSAWRDREGFLFFQAPSTTTFIRNGVQAMLAAAPEGVAAIEGTEPR